MIEDTFGKWDAVTLSKQVDKSFLMGTHARFFRVLLVSTMSLVFAALVCSGQVAFYALNQSTPLTFANPITPAEAIPNGTLGSLKFSERYEPTAGDQLVAFPRSLTHELIIDATEATPQNDTYVSKGGFSINGVFVGDALIMVRRYIHHASDPSNEESEAERHIDDEERPERYHWRGLISQSLFFSLTESTFRIASDDQIRTLLAHKPFLHDYAASLGQFNMRRWNDGDDFLVNYVGHPMQGAVSAFIEIQNDPEGRQQELSATRAYWMSRFKGFLWATVYSTHSEISPIGEAGIGNEGGWTYPLPPKTRFPGDTRKVIRYTNNTGWVDFIITPTVGSLWMLAEDTLDRYVSDRIQGGNGSRILPKIVRGALNPSRTMANAMRFRAPWYRDFRGDADVERHAYGVHTLRSDDEIAAWREDRKREFAFSFRSTVFGAGDGGCGLCMRNPGISMEFDYALTPWFGASFASGGAQIPAQRGSRTELSALNAGFGVRFVHPGAYATQSLAIRPGFVREQLTSPANAVVQANGPARQTRNIDRGAITIAVSNEYKVTSRVALRSSLGDTIVRYRSSVEDPPGIGQAPHFSWLSHDNYANRSTWTLEAGPVLRF